MAATVDEVQRLFDLLGPAWRIFMRDNPESLPWFDGLAPAIEVVGIENGWYVISFVVVGGSTVYVSAISEPDVAVSRPPDGHLLQADRQAGDGIIQFSTLTLTDENRRVLDKVFHGARGG